MRFRYLALVDTRIRGSEVEVIYSLEPGSISVRLPFRVPRFDFLLLAPAFSGRLGGQDGGGVPMIERVSDELLTFRGIDNPASRVHDILKQFNAGDEQGVLHDLVLRRADHSAAFAELGECLTDLTFCSSKTEFDQAVARLRDNLEANNDRVFGSIFFDEALLDSVRAKYAPEEGHWTALVGRAIPSNAANIMKLPVDIWSAKRTSGEFVVQDVHALIDFVCEETPVTNLGTNDFSIVKLVEATLAISESLSQKWAAVIGVLSTIINSGLHEDE